MNKPRVFASSDWHGCGKVAEKVLAYLQLEDILYYLGDATDRGDNGLAILDALMIRPNTFYIQGNHDKMMADAIPFVVRDIEELGYPEGWGYELWLQNGGQNTLSKYENITKTKWFEYKKFLDSCPTELRYKSSKGHTVILEHAGYTPFDIPHRSHDPLWDREHFHDNWASGSGASEIVRNTYLVHGHTPVQYLQYKYGYKDQPPKTKEDHEAARNWFHDKEELCPKPTIIRYCDGHKFDIDLCTIVSNRVALLNLDTFEVKYFDGKEN